MRTPVSARTLVILAATAYRLALASPAAAGEANAEYRELIGRYARGDRVLAVAGLARLSDGELARVVAAGEAAALAAQRRQVEPAFSLRAAVMLHADVDQAERPAPMGREQARRGPGRHAAVAARYARLLAWRPETKDFARRFFVALAHGSQWDACFPDAQRWAGEGLKLFPRDAELLLAAGSALEESATLLLGVSVSDRQGLFERAGAMFTDGLAADPELNLARVRLGRVLWQLGEFDRARGPLEQAVEVRSGDPAVLYLAHLFLGRVHEDSGRLELALRHYRLSLALEPQAQTAAIALSHALRQTGEAGESREVLRRALAAAGRRGRDPYWDYLASNAAGVHDELAALRRESLS